MHVRAGRKTEHQTIDVFKLWCRRRLLRVPLTARGSNQSIWKEISPQYSLKVLMLKLKLQYFGHSLWRAESLEKILVLGKIEGKRKTGQQRMKWSDSITYSMDHDLREGRAAWRTEVHGVTERWTWFTNWVPSSAHHVTVLKWKFCLTERIILRKGTY